MDLIATIHACYIILSLSFHSPWALRNTFLFMHICIILGEKWRILWNHQFSRRKKPTTRKTLIISYFLPFPNILYTVEKRLFHQLLVTRIYFLIGSSRAVYLHIHYITIPNCTIKLIICGAMWLGGSFHCGRINRHY